MLLQRRGEKRANEIVKKATFDCMKAGKILQTQDHIFHFQHTQKKKKLCQESDMLNGLIQIDSIKPRGTL